MLDYYSSICLFIHFYPVSLSGWLFCWWFHTLHIEPNPKMHQVNEAAGTSYCVVMSVNAWLDFSRVPSTVVIHFLCLAFYPLGSPSWWQLAALDCQHPNKGKDCVWMADVLLGSTEKSRVCEAVLSTFCRIKRSIRLAISIVTVSLYLSLPFLLYFCNRGLMELCI